MSKQPDELQFVRKAIKDVDGVLRNLKQRENKLRRKRNIAKAAASGDKGNPAK